MIAQHKGALEMGWCSVSVNAQHKRAACNGFERTKQVVMPRVPRNLDMSKLTLVLVTHPLVNHNVMHPSQGL